MKYRTFGNTNLLVSEIGFGAWAIGGSAMVGNVPIGWGKTDDTVSVAAIRKAVECGINFFDTADFYGLGHSEKLLGSELGRNRDIIIATKVGHRNIDDTIYFDYTKDYILQACELSLKRLNRDTIDYYQLHTARLSHFESGECVEAMQLLQQQGKIRFWGLSLNTFYPRPEAELLLNNNWGNGFQLVLNIINQRATDLLPLAKKKGYGIIARMPLQFGLLTGKFAPGTTFSPDDHRSFRFNKNILNASLTGLNKLVWPMCEKYQVSNTSLSLSYILSHDAVSTVIPGIRTVQQVVDNTTGIVRLASEDMQIIKDAFVSDFSHVVDLMEQQG
jgi:aryl-alcohol dehydrogenase-like predicted oxidoreductase